ncbi:MAG: nucleotidyltransferase domain-containing protein [Planctomycetaceae bacterium]|nr:nucleotidyltransferase domain-containing protein [Planctomycetaceae bacterium]
MTFRIRLRPEEDRLIHSILERVIPSRKVVAFGSRVNGQEKPMSDLDLCVMGDHPLPPLERARLIDTFSESRLPFKVDVVFWSDVNPRSVP